MNNNFDNKSQGKMNDTFMSTFIDDANCPDIHILSNCHNCKNTDIEYFKQDIQKYKNVRNNFIFHILLGCDKKRLAGWLVETWQPKLKEWKLKTSEGDNRAEGPIESLVAADKITAREKWIQKGKRQWPKWYWQRYNALTDAGKYAEYQINVWPRQRSSKKRGNDALESDWRKQKGSRSS